MQSPSGYSIDLVFLFYKLVQWWGSKPTEYLKDKTGISKVSVVFKAKHVVFLCDNDDSYHPYGPMSLMPVYKVTPMVAILFYWLATSWLNSKKNVKRSSHARRALQPSLIGMILCA